MPMRVLGIDPGFTGGLAIIEGEGRRSTIVDLIDVPVIGAGNKCRVDARFYRRWLQRHRPISRGFIERAQAMPTDGRTSAFRYGVCIGYLEAGCMDVGVDIETVEVVVWKRHFGLLSENKTESRVAARSMWAEHRHLFVREQDHNRAESALIASFGLQKLTV